MRYQRSRCIIRCYHRVILQTTAAASVSSLSIYNFLQCRKHWLPVLTNFHSFHNFSSACPPLPLQGTALGGALSLCAHIQALLPAPTPEPSFRGHCRIPPPAPTPWPSRMLNFLFFSAFLRERLLLSSPPHHLSQRFGPLSREPLP